MSLTKGFFSFLSLAAVVAAFSVLTFAQEATTEQKADTAKKMHQRGRMGDHMRGPGKHGRFGRGFQGFRGIELTDAQKAQIKTIREGNKPNEATINELRAIRESRKAGTAITPEQQARLKELREQAATRAKSAHEQMLAILTPEQKATLETRKAEMQKRREERKLNRPQHKRPAATDKPLTN